MNITLVQTSPSNLSVMHWVERAYFFTKHRDLVQSVIYSWFSKNKTVLGVKGRTFTPPNMSLSLCPNTHRTFLQRVFQCQFLLLGQLQDTLDCEHLNSSGFKSFTDLQVCWFLSDPWPVFSHRQVMLCFLSGHVSTVSYEQFLIQTTVWSVETGTLRTIMQFFNVEPLRLFHCRVFGWVKQVDQLSHI